MLEGWFGMSAEAWLRTKASNLYITCYSNYCTSIIASKLSPGPNPCKSECIFGFCFLRYCLLHLITEVMS